MTIILMNNQIIEVESISHNNFYIIGKDKKCYYFSKTKEQMPPEINVVICNISKKPVYKKEKELDSNFKFYHICPGMTIELKDGSRRIVKSTYGTILLFDKLGNIFPETYQSPNFEIPSQFLKIFDINGILLYEKEYDYVKEFQESIKFLADININDIPLECRADYIRFMKQKKSRKEQIDELEQIIKTLQSHNIEIPPTLQFKYNRLFDDSRPPFGVKPRWLVAEQRFKELKSAINSYYEKNLTPPKEWLEEANELVTYLKSRLKTNN